MKHDRDRHKKHSRKEKQKKIQKSLNLPRNSAAARERRKKLTKERDLSNLPKKIRIYLNKEQYRFCYQAGGNYRKIYNCLVADYNKNKEAFEESKKNGTTDEKYFKYDLKQVGKLVTGLRNNPDMEYLKNTNSKIIQQAMRDFNTAVINHGKFPELYDEPTFKSKHDYSYSFRVPIDAIPGAQAKNGIKCVNGNRISICSELKNVLFKGSAEDESWLARHQKKIRSITVSIDPDGKAYASVLLIAQPVQTEPSDDGCGFDLGLKEMVIGHSEKISKDDDGFIVLTGENKEHFHVPSVNDYRCPGQKQKAYERAGYTRLQWYTKKEKRWQRKLSRKEYNTETHTTSRNRDEAKCKFDKKAYRESKREERFQKYLEKRAKTKPFKHLKKNKKKGSSEKNPFCNRKEWNKASNRYEKCRKTKAAKSKKIANIRLDIHQKESTKIVKKYAFIAAETLNVKGMLKNRKLSKAVSTAGWGEFISMIDYKAFRYGRKFVRIDTFFASSKTCSVCGYKYKNLTLSERQWLCPVCGTLHERDGNASIMILTEGVSEHNKELKEFLYGKENLDSLNEAAPEFGETERGDSLWENPRCENTAGVSTKAPMKR